MLVVAHLAQAGARDSALPERLQQATRPKLSEIDGEEARACEAADSPRRVLRQTSRAIAEARFTGKGDREAVQRMLAEIEWTMRTAFDQLLEVLTENEAEPDPSTVRRGRGLLGSEPELLGVEMGSMDDAPSRGGRLGEGVNSCNNSSTCCE